MGVGIHFYKLFAEIRLSENINKRTMQMMYSYNLLNLLLIVLISRWSLVLGQFIDSLK